MNVTSVDEMWLHKGAERCLLPERRSLRLLLQQASIGALERAQTKRSHRLFKPHTNDSIISLGVHSLSETQSYWGMTTSQGSLYTRVEDTLLFTSSFGSRCLSSWSPSSRCLAHLRRGIARRSKRGGTWSKRSSSVHEITKLLQRQGLPRAACAFFYVQGHKEKCERILDIVTIDLLWVTPASSDS